MPLVGYLSTSKDPGRISTLTNLPGLDKDRRKKIVASRRSDRQMYVRDCISHDPPGTVAGVMLMRFIPGTGWIELGVAKCCPLCWRILVPPSNVDLPSPRPLPVVKVATQKQRRALSRGRNTKQGRIINPTKQRLQDLFSTGEAFGTREVMEVTGLSRTRTRNLLMELVQEGSIEVGEVGGGFGKQTIWVGKS